MKLVSLAPVLLNSMIPYSTLAESLSNNVLEVKFHRRRPKKNISAYRRMLCTLDYNLLNSQEGLTILNFKAPRSSSSTQSKGLITVWDILMQDWRTVNTESCSIITTIPTSPTTQFWDYFNKIILPMSPAQKEAFINT